jgi:hypothetical protein
MSNIVGEGFPKKIVEQINVRQNKKGIINRNPGGDPTLLTWQNSNTGWVKVVSSVDLTEERKNIFPAFLRSKSGESSFLDGNQLAKKYVLFGGVTDFPGGGKINAREGIARADEIHSTHAYGIGGLEFGLQPMPGITSYSIKTETRGSLKTATIGIKCFNRTQFDIINTLYLSLGYSVLLEWGNTMYYDNDKKFIDNNPYSLTDEFLEGKYQWDDILSIIQDNRLASCGNYDAALGKVVNFSWTINRDLTYDITLTVRTIGDVIESLKINTLSGYINAKPIIQPKTPQPTEEGATPPEPTVEEAIADFANSSDIGRMLYNIQKQLEPLGPGSTGASTLAIGNDVIAIKQVYKGEKDTNQYYIRFGYFLEQVQANIIPVVKKDNSSRIKKLIKINTNVDKNIIALYNRQISADPGVCLFNSFVPYYRNNVATGGVAFLPNGNKFKFQPDGAITDNYGKLMNVYFNMTYILNSLTDLKDDEGKVSLIDFLTIFSNGFNNATGNFNRLSPSVDEDTNEIRFIDEVPLPDRNAILQSQGKSIEEAFFTLFGYFPYTDKDGEDKAKAGIVRDISLTTTITPNLASMITIGAQANGYITGQDSTALSSINKGLKDRVKPVIQDAGKKDIEQPPQPLNVQYADQINAFLNFIAKIGSVNGAYPGWDQDAIDAYRNTNNAFVEYDQYLATSTAQKLDPKKPIGSPTIGFLPFDLTLTIDGLSGMKVYQKYIIDTDFLPSNYPSSLEFLIKGITHTIQNNQWITTLESVAIPKNPFGMKNAQGQTYKGSPSTVGGRPVGVAAEIGQPVRGNNFSPSSTPISKGPQADYWSLVAIAAAENFVNNPQGMADVAQSIYNRLNAGGYGKSIKSIVVAAGQYEPTFRNPGDWKAIKDKNTAIKAYQNSKGVSLAVATSAIETSEKALKNPTYKSSAKTFIGSRTEFLASRPNSSSAVGIVERNPINLNNAFFWNYNGKIQFYNKKILVAQNPPSNIPNLV